MAPAWKAAGFTYNRYLAISARVVRRSLKDDLRIKAEQRGNMELRFSKWQSGKQQETQSLAKALDEQVHEDSQKASSSST